MTARLLDTTDDEDFDKDPLAGALDATSAPVPAPAAAATPPSDPEIPEPYRGKSVGDLIGIIRDKEAMIGRQSQEVGSARSDALAARKLLDKALEFGTSTGRPDVNTEARAFGREDLLERPQEVVRSIVREELKGTQDELGEVRQVAQAKHFAEIHPTATNDMNDPVFVAWFQASPYRQRIAAKVFADPQKTDWEAADELWTGYESTRVVSATQPTPAPAKDTSQKPSPSQPNVADISLMRGGSGGGTAPIDGNGKERFKASVLHDMQVNKPELYWSAAIQNRIMKGHVIDDM